MAGVAPFQRAERELTVWQAGVHEAIAGAPELGAETAAGAEHGAEADAGVEQGAQHVQMTGIYESVSPEIVGVVGWGEQQEGAAVGLQAEQGADQELVEDC